MSYSGHGTIHLAWGDLKAEVGDLAITVVVLHFTKVSERTPGHASNHYRTVCDRQDEPLLQSCIVSCLVQNFTSWQITAM